jgi:hypothetical protein
LTDLALAYRATAALIGLCLLQQSAELLRLGRAWSAGGVFDGPRLRGDLAAFPTPLRTVLAPLYAAWGFRALLWLRLGLGLLLVAAPGFAASVSALLATLLVCVRFRGVFNGGSDYMTVVVLSGLSLSGPAAAHARVGLSYVAVQSLLSYVIAGVAKLRAGSWRNGTAMASFLTQPHYGVPAPIQRIAQRPALCRALSFGVIAFECGMPVALISPGLCLVAIAVAGSFHAGTVAAFGLNRFLWAWLASYPALLWLSASVHFGTR